MSNQKHEQDSVQLCQLNTWLLDLQLSSDGVVLLGAGVNSEVDNTLYYALMFMETKNDAIPTVEEFVLLDHTQKYSEETENQLLSYRLLLPNLKSNTIFIYNSTSILMLEDKSTLDKMDMRTSQDCLLGAGRSDGLALFFSNTHGIFSVSTPRPDVSILDQSNNQTMSISRAELSTMALNMSKAVDITESSDSKVILKNALIASIGGEAEKAQSLVEELCDLSQGPTSSDIQGSKLDSIVAAVSRDLVDDFPNADPRWAESGLQNSSSSTVSVIIVQQLKDKQVAHDLFVTFLKNYGLWNQLGCVSTIHGNMMPTSLLLCEHVEKLEAAKGLRELHTEHTKLLDHCIRSVVKARQQSLPSTLLPQDLFYREVSKVSEILPVLVSREKELLASDQPSHTVVSLILAVNAILEAMLHLALQYRQTNVSKYAEESCLIPGYTHWTATPDIREAITQQINLSLQHGVPEAREIDVQGLIYQNIVGLADILMDGYASQLRSLDSKSEAVPDSSVHRYKLEKEFEKKRHSLIIPLLENKQYDRAASLAEKYEDFEMLMRICDATDNQDRLQRYRMQYANKGFAKFLFEWYMREGKRSHLLAQPVMEGDELSNFLDADNVKYLSWLHEIKQRNYTGAQRALADLATDEKNFLSKKKTLLSLSKLAALASEDIDENLEDNIEVINEELELITHQELLPAHAIESIGMDPDNMRVLTPVELIELYVSEKNTNASELDVKKALDLLKYVDRDGDVDFKALALHIWCRAILLDSWEEDPNDADPLNSNKDKVFFKTVYLVHIDGDLELYLPDLSALIASPELAEISRQPHFQYLMRGGYEQIRAVLAQSD
ncbi:nuclear pore complex protein Nup133 [Elysia marginata]|uniref:Nuclear pore complex protein Nup133 n=1 Tax=Elysia marginata TaxID=1093978 RepID=A0AAV4J8Q1_9GAST|nr:nuclear pore complex protein Nup133 [Elysia marginata]